MLFERFALSTGLGDVMISTIAQPSAVCGAAVAGVAATCIKSGTCAAGITGSQVYAALQAAASERRTLAGRPAFGFTGDPASTINGKYMGNMIWAKF